MYLFSRSTRVANADGMAWAVGMTEHAKRVTGLDIGLWGQVWSPEFGRIAWTTFVPDLATLAAAGDKMATDAAMNAEAEKGAALTTDGMDDALFNVLHGEIDPSAPQPEYVTTVAAVCANGSLTKGMTTGVEIAQRAEKVTGTAESAGGPALPTPRRSKPRSRRWPPTRIGPSTWTRQDRSTPQTRL